MNTQRAISLELLIKRSNGNHDLAFSQYLKLCMVSKLPVVIPTSIRLNLKKGKIPINGNLKIIGGGTIQGTGKNNLFRVEDGATITIKDIKFEKFNAILKCGKRDIGFSLDVDSIQLSNCFSLISTATNNQQRKKVGPIQIQNSKFENCKGPIIEIRNLYLDRVKIKNNQFINKVNLRNKRAVIEIGSGTNASKAKNIDISNNKIENFRFTEIGCGIIVHGASEVNISNNDISRIHCLASMKQSYGIYIKANNAIISKNKLFNAGDGEAAIINKGLAKNHSLTTPGTNSGDNVLIEDNEINYTDHYHRKTKKSITGITVTGSNQTVRNNIIGNVTNGIELRSGPMVNGLKYSGGFKITGNRIKKLQHCVKDTSVVRAISIMQGARNILIENNEITFTDNIQVKPKYIYGITVLTISNTKNINILKNKIKNKIPFKASKTSFAVNFRPKGIVEGLSITKNKIDGFSFGVVLNDNNNQSVYKEVDVANDYSNIKKKRLRMLITKPDLHTIKFKKE